MDPKNPPTKRLVLVGTTPTQGVLAKLGEAAAQAGIDPIVVDTRALVPLEWSPSRPTQLRAGPELLDEHVGVYLHALPPRFGSWRQGPQRSVDGQTFVGEQATADGPRDVLCAWLEEIAQAGSVVLNPPRGGGLLQNKPAQLAAAQRLGLRVPATCWSTDAQVLGGFVAGLRQDGREALHKPVRAWGGAELVEEAQLEGLKAAGEAWAGRLVQERRHGLPVRVLMLQGKVVSACRLEGLSTGDVVDHRAHPAYQRGETRYVPVELPALLVERLARLQLELGWPWGGADLIESGDGYWFLELNPAPVWVEQQARTGHPIADELLATLMGDGQRGP